MAGLMEEMLNEFREEAATTKRLLDRVPGDKLSWKPHSKSMTLGQLANHVAAIPGNLTRIVQLNEFDVAQAAPVLPSPASIGEIHETFEKSVQSAEECLKGMSEQTALANWRLLAKGREVFTRPRIAVMRKIMLNHWYHHRGQLSVYLRMLDVPVPVIYGRSADEDPFA
jgi:uncharacterized damage-inducible protein DinB